MSSFGKLIKAAKNQPIEEEAPVDLIPETSTNDSTPKKTKKVSSKNETSTNGLKKAPTIQKDSSKNRSDTNTPTEVPISDQKEASNLARRISERAAGAIIAEEIGFQYLLDNPDKLPEDLREMVEQAKNSTVQKMANRSEQYNPDFFVEMVMAQFQ